MLPLLKDETTTIVDKPQCILPWIREQERLKSRTMRFARPDTRLAIRVSREDGMVMEVSIGFVIPRGGETVPASTPSGP